MYGSGWGGPYYSPWASYGSFRGGGREGGRGGRASVQPYRNATWTKDSSSTPRSATPTIPGTFKNQKLVVHQDGTTTSTSDSATQAQSAPSTADREVDIDGIVFLKQGNKLIRKEGPSEASSTPKKATHGGTQYVRTKNGNLVAADIVKKRKETLAARLMAAKKERLDRLVGIVSTNQAARNAQMPPHNLNLNLKRQRGQPKSTKLCKYFQKTGQCTNGLRCRFVHDSNKVAICQQFLRGKCPMSATTCPLSHQPNAHRSPHCVHFPNCKNGIDCPYAHVHVSRDAPLCRDFAESGWCEAGEKCDKRHAIECPRFADSGVCNKKGCKLPHILRRRNDPSVVDHQSGVLDQATNPTDLLSSEGEGEEEAHELDEPQGISERFQKKNKTTIADNDDFVGFESSGEEEEDTDDVSDVDSDDSVPGQQGTDDDSDEDGDADEVAGMLFKHS